VSNKLKYGLTPREAMWLAYHIGQTVHGSGLVTTGRDIMRVIHERWDQMGLPVETMKDFEKEILRNDHPFSMSVIETQRRAIHALAGDCPIGPLERIMS
jgi:hypothetical protein